MVKKVNGVSFHDLLGSCIRIAVLLKSEEEAGLDEGVIQLTEFAIVGWQGSDADAEEGTAEPPAAPAAARGAGEGGTEPRVRPTATTEAELVTGRGPAGDVPIGSPRRGHAGQHAR